MGASHVSKVYTRWAHLPDRPFRLLTYMALIAKDSTPEPAYWGGREGLCIALGLPNGEASSHRMARQVMARLIRERAVERTYIGHAGKRSEYRLNLDGAPLKEDSPLPQIPVDDTAKGGLSSPPEGGAQSPQRGTVESAKGDSPVPPRNTEEEEGAKSEEDTSPTSVSTEGAGPGEAKAMSELEARRVIRQHTDDNGHHLRMTCTLPITGADLTIWCAQQILTRQETA